MAVHSPVPPAAKTLPLTADWRFGRGDPPDAAAVGFDDANWTSLEIPHDWSVAGPFDARHAGLGGAKLPTGIGWYRLRVNLPPSWQSRRVHLEFDGVYWQSTVWINGQRLGFRPNGYVPFSYDLTPHLNWSGQAEQVIAVRVDNEAQPNSRWYTGSGIYRQVRLTATAPTAIEAESVFCRLEQLESGTASVLVDAALVNTTELLAQGKLVIALLDERGTVVAETETITAVAAGEQDVVQRRLRVDQPRLWSPDTPFLYRLRLQYRESGQLADDLQLNIGLRTIRFDPQQGFFLNGTPLRLKGVCQHADLGCLGTAVNRRALERQIQILKEMGGNAIRTAHNPPAPEFIDLCDRLGVLVVDEAFDKWNGNPAGTGYDRHFDQWAERDLRAFVRRDRNHACVILWSVGNEVGGPPAICEKLCRWVREEDPTRPVSVALNGFDGVIDNGMTAMLDVVGYNYFGGWQFGPEKYDIDHARFPARPIYGSETCSVVRSRGHYHIPAGIILRYAHRAPNEAALARLEPQARAVRTDQDHEAFFAQYDGQCANYENCMMMWSDNCLTSWQAVLDRPFVAGEFVWTGFDYLGEPSPYEARSRSSYFGILDTCGFPKDAFYFYQSVWSDRPTLHLFPHWNWQPGQLVTVACFTNCASVELFLNGRALGCRSQSLDRPTMLTWSVTFEPGTLEAIGHGAGAEPLRARVVTAGAAAGIALSLDRENPVADGNDLVFVTAHIQDANGNLVPMADNLVSFAVQGPARLVGVDNGDPTSYASLQGPDCAAFAGQCLAVIRTTCQAGPIVITARGEGLAPARAELVSQAN